MIDPTILSDISFCVIGFAFGLTAGGILTRWLIRKELKLYGKTPVPLRDSVPRRRSFIVTLVLIAVVAVVLFALANT